MMKDLSMTVSSPFDDLTNLLEQLPNMNSCSGNKVREDLGKRPIGGQGGRLTELLVWLANWQGEAEPKLNESHICVLASSYVGGMGADGINGYIELASSGQSYVNQLCKTHGLGLRVLEMAVEMPHKISPQSPDWDQAGVMAAVAFGMEATASGGHILGLGELAFGSEPYAIAIICKLMGIETGQFAKEAGLLKAAGKAQQMINQLDVDAPLDILLALGGREMAAAVGAILAARSRRLPVLLDGWAASVAAIILWKMAPSSIDHCQLSASLNDAHLLAMGKIGMRPIVDVSHDCGMGVGSAMALNVLKGAIAMLDLPVMSE